MSAGASGLSGIERGTDRAASGWLKVFSAALMILGVSLFAVYLVYLPRPQWFQSDAALQQFGIADPGMILYSLASAGAAFVVWGRLLAGLRGEALSRAAVMRASALGMALLALMRVGTACFPHGPFMEMLALPIAECILFGVIAFCLYRSA